MLNSISKRFQDSDTSQITISAPGKTGQYNMIKTISAYSDATASISIASPSTTTVIWAGLSGAVTPLLISFPEGAEPKGSENGAVYVSCSAGTYRISVTGVVGG